MWTRGRKFGNDTIDVASKGCFFDTYDTVACVRTSLLATSAAVTLVFVILKIVKYHVFRHRQVHHYALFYVSALECLICGTCFLVGNHFPQLEFSAGFLKLLQFTIICHLHWSLAARSLSREDIVQYLINPVLCLHVLYCTTVALMGMVDVAGSWTECMRPYWLMLSTADFAIVQTFLMAAIYVTHRMEGIWALASFKSTQTKDVWSVIAAYEFSAIITISFDAVMRFVGSEKEGCSSLFAHTQIVYSTAICFFMVAKFFVPMWTILHVFQPVEKDSRSSAVALAGRYNTDKAGDPVSHTLRHHYRRMFVPQITVPVTCHPPISDFTNLHSGVGDLISEHDSPINCRTMLGKMPIITATGLSTISEESANVSVVDSPTTEGSIRSEHILAGSEKSQYLANC